MPYLMPYAWAMRKTSVYLSGDRNFVLAAGFPRIDRDPRPISGIPEEELLEGFGG